MSICQVCNGLREILLVCPGCGGMMADNGKLMDFYDDYSPYMDVEIMKMEDGYPDTHSGHKCPHLYSCPQCHRSEVLLIQE